MNRCLAQLWIVIIEVFCDQRKLFNTFIILTNNMINEVKQFLQYFFSNAIIYVICNIKIKRLSLNIFRWLFESKFKGDVGLINDFI